MSKEKSNISHIKCLAGGKGLNHGTIVLFMWFNESEKTVNFSMTIDNIFCSWVSMKDNQNDLSDMDIDDMANQLAYVAISRHIGDGETLVDFLESSFEEYSPSEEEHQERIKNFDIVSHMIPIGTSIDEVLMKAKHREYKKGVEAAKQRIKEANLDGKTLVSEIHQHDWDNWDKRNEDALVADKDGIKDIADDLIREINRIRELEHGRSNRIYMFPFMNSFFIGQGMAIMTPKIDAKAPEFAKEFVKKYDDEIVRRLKKYHAYKGEHVMLFDCFSSKNIESGMIYIKYTEDFINFIKNSDTDYYPEMYKAVDTVLDNTEMAYNILSCVR